LKFSLDSISHICKYPTDMFSSEQVAKKLGITGATLSRYISAGKLPTPQTATAGGMTLYQWTEEDVKRAQEMLPKIANGRKTRHQRKKKTRMKQAKKK
jgi:predicted DNA-binding transcriptional regulator AlpA